jgi:hypothetical protein
MANGFTSQQSLRNAPGPKPAKKLYSLAALMQGKNFIGSFETSTGKYDFIFAPRLASFANGKLELTGSLSVEGARGAKREVKDARATLLSLQSGLGDVPDVILARAGTGSTAKPLLPVTEASDLSGYVGVMYLRFAPINSRALGLTIDMSGVQLNARLFSDSQIERHLRVLYSDLSVGKPGSEATTIDLASLNQILNRG